MEDKLIAVATFNDYIEAEMARQLLADNGIEAVVTGENASNLYQMAVEGPELQVRASDVEQALEILASQNEEEEAEEGGNGSEEDGEDDEDEYDE
jgi:hypothetical protein